MKCGFICTDKLKCTYRIGQTIEDVQKRDKQSSLYRVKARKLRNRMTIKVILKCIWCCCKANRSIVKLLNHLFSYMGLFTMQNNCVSCFLDYFKAKLESKLYLFSHGIPVSKKDANYDGALWGRTWKQYLCVLDVVTK